MIETYGYARAGFLVNPCDGGKAIGVAVIKPNIVT